VKNKPLVLLAVWVCFFLAVCSVSAHHGTAEFDNTKLTTIKGTVTDFIWTNPHGSIDLDVQNAKGTVEKWQGFLTSPNFLARAGWNKNTVKQGDDITLTGSLAKNHANMLRVTKVQLANGQELTVGGLEN
jgi:hypothetical protein